jgi:hypothetical protein
LCAWPVSPNGTTATATRVRVLPKVS